MWICSAVRRASLCSAHLQLEFFFKNQHDDLSCHKHNMMAHIIQCDTSCFVTTVVCWRTNCCRSVVFFIIYLKIYFWAFCTARERLGVGSGNDQRVGFEPGSPRRCWFSERETVTPLNLNTCTCSFKTGANRHRFVWQERGRPGVPIQDAIGRLSQWFLVVYPRYTGVARCSDTQSAHPILCSQHSVGCAWPTIDQPSIQNAECYIWLRCPKNK